MPWSGRDAWASPRSAKSARGSSTNGPPGPSPARRSEGKFFCFDWAKENIGSFGTPTVQHLELVVISVVARLRDRLRPGAAGAPPPLAAAAAAGGDRRPLHVPSIAFFFLLLPITGRGRDTVIIALSAYTLQIIYRNTLAGLANVPDSVRDAARGMGLTERQILWRVELPLATPEIVAGLRIATVSTVAIATLAVFAGGGGLGRTDLRRRQPHLQDEHHHRRRDRDR